jgi:hypothetical protein
VLTVQVLVPKYRFPPVNLWPYTIYGTVHSPNWEVDFYRERCISDFRETVTGHPSNGHTHTHVILDGPSTHHHPLWSAAVNMEKDKQGKKITPHPLHYNLQSTMPSQVLTPNTSGLRTPPNHSHAPVALPSAHHNTSHGNAPYFTKYALIMQSTLMGTLLHTPPSTTPIPTNSSRSYKIAMSPHILLTLDPQWK